MDLSFTEGALKAKASFLAASFVALVASAPASSQPQLIKQPEVILKSYDIATIGPVLTELGVQWRRSVSKGEPYIAATYRDLDFIITPEACRGAAKTNCLGAHMIAVFRGAPFNQQTVNAFNARFAFTSAGLDPSGDAFISRYEICDYGEARGNFAISLAVYLNQAISFRKALADSPVTASANGFSSDLDAARLNRASFAAIGGSPAVLNEAASHGLAIDGAAARISALIAAGDIKKNQVHAASVDR